MIYRRQNYRFEMMPHCRFEMMDWLSFRNDDGSLFEMMIDCHFEMMDDTLFERLMASFRYEDDALFERWDWMPSAAFETTVIFLVIE